MSTVDSHEAGWRLLRAAQGGNRDAFGQLWTANRPAVVTSIRRYVRNPSEVEDLAAETSLRAWRSRHRVHERDVNVAAWLVTIGRNLALDHVKSSGHRRTLFAEDLNGEDGTHDWIYPEVPDPSDAASEAEQGLELAARIEFYLNQLTPRQKLCLLLRFYQGLSTAEVAEALGVRVEAAKATQHRASVAVAELMRMNGYRSAREFLTDRRAGDVA